MFLHVFLDQETSWNRGTRLGPVTEAWRVTSLVGRQGSHRLLIAARFCGIPSLGSASAGLPRDRHQLSPKIGNGVSATIVILQPYSTANADPLWYSGNEAKTEISSIFFSLWSSVLLVRVMSSEVPSLTTCTLVRKSRENVFLLQIGSHVEPEDSPDFCGLHPSEEKRLIKDDGSFKVSFECAGCCRRCGRGCLQHGICLDLLSSQRQHLVGEQCDMARYVQQSL